MNSPATDKQLNFILTLAGERFEGDALDDFFTFANSGDVKKGAASALIKGLLETPKLAKAAPVVRATQPATTLVAGRYAVEIDGVLGFFKIDVPESGKWVGYTFVKQMASDDEYPVKGARKGAVLAAVEEDPKAASIRYGAELGRCGVCNRTLTDAASREAGIGPVCAQNAGW